MREKRKGKNCSKRHEQKGQTETRANKKKVDVSKMWKHGSKRESGVAKLR